MEKRLADNAFLRKALFPLAQRFIAGVSREDALRAASELSVQGFVPVINLLGEDGGDEHSVAHTMEEYRVICAAVQTAERTRPAYARSPLHGTRVSIKLSQLGLICNEEGRVVPETIARARENLGQLLVWAYGGGNARFTVPVEIDAEHRTSFLVQEMLLHEFSARYSGLRLALQARLPEADYSLVRLCANRNARVRLVKGAYPEGLADPQEIFHAFLRQALYLFNEGTLPAFATHDRLLIHAIMLAAKAYPWRRFEFQMLHGFKMKLQQSLLAQGYRVAIYVPYGDTWLPYGLRRINAFLRGPKETLDIFFG